MSSDGSLAKDREGRTSPRCVIAGDFSGTNLNHEIEGVLRSRLRAAAFILCFGFIAFSVKMYFEGLVAGPVGVTSALFRLFVIAVMFAATRLLCIRHPHTLKGLRVWELVIFGVPAAYFAWMSWEYGRLRMDVTERFEVHDRVAGMAIPWITLIYVYGMFIPNTWKRAAAFTSFFLVIPLTSAFLGAWSNQGGWGMLGFDAILSLALWLGIPAVAAVYGTHMIGRLRRQAVVGKQLGSYRLVRKLGVGGMGEVYLAEHRLLKRPCAIKLIRAGQSNDPQAIARFESEVQATARLTHWNSIEIFDYGHTGDGTFYYAMEYLPGMNLQEMVDATGPLSPERTIHLLRQVCAALNEAHAMGLVHRDIKPGNIFAAQRGGIYDVAKLLDFGLVKSTFPHTQSPKITLEGSLVGSPLYVAPEHAMGENEFDARGDIYSLGATGYFLLTGQPVFSHDKPLKLIFAHVNEPVMPPSRLRPEIPSDLESVLMRCLAKNPEDRFQNTVDLAMALSACECADGWTQEHAVQWWRTYRDKTPAPVLDDDFSEEPVRETTLMEVKIGS